MLRFCDDVGEILSRAGRLCSFGSRCISFGDAVKKFRANDAPATPNRRDVPKIQIPAVGCAGGTEQLHPLGVGNNFRCVKRVVDGLDQAVPIAAEFVGLAAAARILDAATRSSLREEITRASTAALMVEMTTDCLNGGLQSPDPGPFLAGLVENHIDQRFAGVGIDRLRKICAVISMR